MADRVRQEVFQLPHQRDLAELGSLSLRTALTETVGQLGPNLSGSSLEDLRSYFRRFSSQAQFGQMAHRYFGDYFARVLRS